MDRYLFTPGGNVGPEDFYTEERGFGFLTEQTMEEIPRLMLPELNGGFMSVPWRRLLEPARIRQNDCGCMIQRPETVSENEAEAVPENARQLPLRFKCHVDEEGSYRVKVVIRAREKLSDIRVFTGRRCLAAYRESLPAGETLACELYTEVCGIIPRGQEKTYHDRCIEVSVTADAPCISEIEIEPVHCPVLYIAGDSTVTDQSAEYPYAPGASYAGWGQMLPFFLKGCLTVSNHSHSGLTTESFRQEGHAAIPFRRCKPGDFMFFQFGHNDQKLMHLKAQEGYRANLEAYIAECRKMGVHPLLVTPVARNTWRGNDGQYNDLLQEYADACLEIGRRLSVPVLDLHRLSMEFIIRLGKENAKRYFYPSDYTHHNDFGAAKMAAFVCAEIKRTCMEGAYLQLASHIQESPVEWPEPAFVKPLQRPEGFIMDNGPAEWEDPDRPSDLLLRAEALDMVIRRAGFFITNVYNDLFTDIIGHEWYAGAVECALQNGLLTEELCEGRLFRPLEPVTLLDFTVFLMGAYGSRKTLPAARPCPYDGAVSEKLRPLISAACQLHVLAADGTDALNGHISRKQGSDLCRKLKIM
ncbi:MAG: GDSL-type esterase/lipase family protein [Blautia sp.]|nr:GDSL-type esterase/lipase family protein [Blautia sp.]MCM1200203.1 GDSL-type esterase/lipase family protein [Bacteroides fragilis]